MARGKAISDEVRAQVIAELLAGAGVSEVSRKLKLAHATVSRIKSTITPKKLDEVGRETADKMDVMICSYLEKNLAAMGAICDVASDASYLRRHSPSQLAGLHEELSSKAFQLIEAEPIEEAI